MDRILPRFETIMCLNGDCKTPKECSIAHICKYVHMPDHMKRAYLDELEPKPQYDAVSHPRHYTTHPSGIECIEITRHMNFNLGNAIKYIWRANEKENAVVDLQKAIWYLNDEIKKLENGSQK